MTRIGENLVRTADGTLISEAELAHSRGYQLCPMCGDWLPRHMVQFRCGGQGKHINTAPIVPPKPEAQTVDPVERFVMWFVGACVVALIVTVCGLFIAGHR